MQAQERADGSTVQRDLRQSRATGCGRAADHGGLLVQGANISMWVSVQPTPGTYCLMGD